MRAPVVITALFFSLSTMAQSISVNQINSMIKDYNCISCHSHGSTFGSFEELDTKEKWIESGFVIPGSPEQSRLIKKLQSEGGNMPPYGAPITLLDVQTLKTWIAELSSTPTHEESIDLELDVDLGYDTTNLEIQLQVYARCYAFFTRSGLTKNDQNISKIERRELTAADACMNILQMANLNPETGEIQDHSTTAKSILKTFYDFHLSWFPSRDFIEQAQADPRAIHEEGQPANYLTYALFGRNGTMAFQDIFKENLALATSRIQADENREARFPHHSFPQEEGIARAQKGHIIGFREQSPHYVSSARSIFTTGIIDENIYNIFENLGGGVLGSQSYLMLNAGTNKGILSDGGIRLIRNFPNRIFKHFFCRDLPVIEPRDSLDSISETFSSLTFKNHNSCMQCHASIDSMAKGLRNIQYTAVNPEATGQRLLPFMKKYLGELAPSEDPHAWPDKDPSFYKRAPLGRLFYRDLNGNLVNKYFEGISELGSLLSQQDNVYACTASRYFFFLTGIRVHLDSIENENYRSTLSSKDLLYRKFILELGQKLKQDQSVQLLIKRIINSKAFIEPGIGVK